MIMEKATKTITASGNSLVINVTTEVKRLGLDHGDSVNVTLSSEKTEQRNYCLAVLKNALRALNIQSEKDYYKASKDDLKYLEDCVSTCLPRGYITEIWPDTIEGFYYLEIRTIDWQYLTLFYTKA